MIGLGGFAQDAPAPTSPTEDPAQAGPPIAQVDAASIKTLRGQVEAASDVDDETKAQILAVLDQAAQELVRAGQFDAASKTDRDAVQNVGQRLEVIQNEIEDAPKNAAKLPSDSASLSELESFSAQQTVLLQEAKNRLAKLQAESGRRSERRKQIAILDASREQRVAEAETQLAASAPGGESSLMTNSRNMLQLARLQSLASEGPANRWELARYDAEQAVDLTAIQVDRAQSELKRTESVIARLSQRIDELRKKQARTRVEKLQDFAEAQDDQAARLAAQRNADLAAKNEGIVQLIGSSKGDTESVQERLNTNRDLVARTQQRLERVGLSGAIGLELRKQLSDLPDARTIKRQSLKRQETMRSVELSRLEYEDAWRELQQNPLDPDADALERRIHDDYAEALSSLMKNYDQYFQQLSELDFIENQLIGETETYREFLNEHILWIRSHPPFGWDAIKQSVSRLVSFLKPDVWGDVLGRLWFDAKNHISFYAMALVAMLLLVPVRYRGRQQLVRFGRAAERPGCIEFSITLRAAILTVIMAMVWPLAMLFIGWRLSALPLESTFSVSVGRGLMATAVVLTLLNIVRHSCRDSGLAISHFGWPKRSAELLRRKARQLRFLLLPLVFLTVTLEDEGELGSTDGLIRLCFIAGAFVLAWMLFGILRPRGGVMVEYFHKHSETWFAKTRKLWFAILVGFPIVMALLTAAGFYYTASELTWRFWNTVWIAVSLVWLRAIAIRALQVNHRKLRIQKLKERRAGQESDSSVTGEALTIEMEHEAIRTSSEQAIRILHSALLVTGLSLMWVLWSGIFPAFRILDQWTLWDTTREVAVQVPLADGSFKTTNETIVDPVTPVDISYALVIGLLTFTLVRNVPGLIEITILQRLPLEASFKFAIVMMCRYAILVVGLLMMFSAVGASWSKLQWLVAALTVGLGFGLQEIFGNFVSGIIILWERPVRIGDVVTLDGVSGTVSRIQMRATTISDWDRKEYIVPNKDFVTGRLLNWTRSDQISRFVINVGVAYGSDVELALKLLREAANEHPLVLKDPSPSATFEKFGDSTLDLVLRCFMPNLDGRLETISDMHLAVDHKFREAGLEIAFPQRDLHIRSIDSSVSMPSNDSPGRTEP